MSQRAEPIAVVGIGVRLPGGATSPASFWKLLAGGVDAIVDVPPDRWSAARFSDARTGVPGTIASRAGGFVRGIELFDHEFFGISPREAARMDPQQRMLLEVAWEALEDAGIRPDLLRGQPVGVFVGISQHDYSDLQHGSAQRREISAHTNTGVATSIAANRISYALDLRGPSAAVDTACSSSLVAVHLACQSLRAGETSLALVGGVNLVLRPEPSIGFSKAGMLSPDSRCHAFDHRANGYVRAEGAGVVALKPLAAALDDGDRVYAVILGSAVNQDGHTPGITMPGIDAQQALLREAYGRAGVDPARVAFVEAHGTGTPVGDPIEATALGTVLGRAAGRVRPLLLGAVKTNIGHLESGAGLAGLVKTCLALHHRQIPRNLHFEAPNLDIDFEALGIAVPRAHAPWPDGDAFAGVNSFGFGGTNAHVVLAAAPPAAAAADDDGDSPHLFVLSAKTEAALEELALACIDRLSAHELAPADVCHTAIARRAHHRHRLGIVARTTFDIVDALAAVTAGTDHDLLIRGAGGDARGIVFVYSGMGPQWWAMGRALLAHEPAFARVIHECDAALRELAPWSLVEELARDEAASRMRETAIAQPASFALQLGLTALWKSWGITPAAIVGHSAGEVAAGCAAGAYDLRTACAIIYHRSRIQQLTRGEGTLVALAAMPGELRGRLAEAPRVAIAAVNAPSSLTLVGTRADLEAFVAPYLAAGRFVRFLEVDVPFHGAAMDPHREALGASLGTLSLADTSVPFYSTVTAARAAGRELDAEYWWRNVRDHVRFADTIGELLAAGHTRFLELGAHPVLADSVRACAAARGVDVQVHHSLRRNTDEREYVRRRLAELYVQGHELDGAGVEPHGRYVPLPTYAWQHTRAWLESEESLADRTGGPIDPIVGERADERGTVYAGVIDLAALPWLADHRIEQASVYPAAGYVAMALASIDAAPGEARVVEDLTIERALVVEPGKPVRTTLHTAGRRAEISVREPGRSEWETIATCQVLRGPAGASAPIADARAHCTRAIDPEALYARLAACGYRYGAAFRGVRELHVGDGEAIGTVVLPADAREPNVAVHPALVDATFHIALAAALDGDYRLALPIRIRRVELQRALGERMVCHAHVATRRSDGFDVDVRCVDPDSGAAVLAIDGLRCRFVDAARAADLERLMFRVEWERAPEPAAPRLPAPRAALDEALAARAGAPDAAYRALAPKLDEAALAFVAEAIAELAGERAFDEAVVAERVHPRHRKLFARLLRHLAVGKRLALEANRWSWCAAPRAGEGAELLAEARPTPEHELVGRAGAQLAVILRGEVDPLGVLFPVDGSDVASRFYARGAMFEGYNAIARDAIRAATAALGERARTRVLEVGGGTGSLTAAVLEALPPRHNYVFTDVSSSFLAIARERFGAGRAFETAIFDAQRPPLEQGLEPGACDLVLASNVLHATPDLRETLRNVHALLAPGGWLVLLEVTSSPMWVDIVFGLTEGWWMFSDARSGSPLVSSQTWTSLLADAGFDDIASTPDPDGRAAQTLFVARARPSRARQRGAVLCDGGPLGEAIVSRLRDSGHEAHAIDTLDAALAHGPIDLVVHACGDAASLASADPFEQARRVLETAQDLDRRGLATRLAIVTAGAQAVLANDRVTCPHHAAVIGLGRVVQKELPKLRCIAIDLPDVPTADDVARAVDALAGPCVEPELAIRGGDSYVPRVIPEAAIDHGPPFRLAARQPGDLRSLTACAAPMPRPRRDEVVIATRAAGLNFKEILKASGRLSATVLEGGFSGAELGMECAGIVHAVGEDVHDFRVGDTVVALAKGAIASFVATPAELCAHVPAGLSLAQAAAVPVAYVTAAYSLETKAQLRRGETVLVHAATGGVGFAAIEIAKHAGAEVIATAGSADKRELLVRERGVTAALDSRARWFARDVRALTRGRGVDVVLNSLAGEAIAEGLASLAPYGRFVELGKQDIDANRPVGLGPFGENLTLMSVDVDRLIHDRPREAGDLLRELIGRIAAGELAPPPVTQVPIAAAEQAFRLMAQAKHVGKVVLAFDGPAPRVSGPALARTRLRRDGAYLVTGGLGGFGLEVARWLARRGAGEVVLVGRRAPDERARAAITEIEALGVRVTALQLDVGDAACVRDALAQRRAHSTPLRGVFHAAMVIADGLVQQLDRRRFAESMTPKALGAFHLHRETHADPLDYFVLFSSISAIVGAAGQANYVAANCALDALAHHRRRSGLAATSIAWGSFGDVGYVSRHRDVGDHLERTGLFRFSSAQALGLLDRALGLGAAYVIAADMDWRRAGRTYPGIAHTLLARVQDHDTARPETVDGEVGRASVDALGRLRAASPRERAALVEELVADEVARVLENAVARTSRDRKLSDLGLDSLLSVELIASLARKLGVELAMAEVFRGPTIRELAQIVLARLHLDQPARATASLVARPVALNDASGPPLFVVPAGIGELVALRDIARRISSHAVWALEPPTAHAFEDTGTLREALLASYLAALRASGAPEPWCLGGYSTGGVVAFELAHQLAAGGSHVPLLCLIDSPFRRPDWYRTQETLDAMPDDAKRNLLGDGAVGMRVTDLDPGLRLQLAAMSGYTPPATPVKLSFIAGARSLFWTEENRDGWASVAEVEHHVIDATHHELLRAPHSETLAALLSMLLERDAQRA